MEDYMSNWSSGSPGSTPHTPLEQAPPPFLSHGVGSVTSLCTTDDEDAESQYPWTAEHEQFVAQVLQEYQDNPRNTPFSGRFPPSGVVQQVARTVMRRAPRDQFPHSLVAVRKQILVLCAREDYSEPPVEASAYSEPLMHFTPQGQHAVQQTGALGGHLGGAPGSLHVNTSNRGAGTLGTPLMSPQSSQPDYDQFDFGNSRHVPLSSPFKEEHRINRPGTSAYQPQNHQQPQQPVTDEHVLNIVAQRKRDSLKMKRGLK